MMRVSVPRHYFVAHCTSIVRLLTLILAVLAIIAGGTIDQPALVICGAYFLVAALLYLSTFVDRDLIDRPRIRYVSVLFDVGFVAAFTTVHVSPDPLWTLYLFPLASAAATGLGETVLAAILVACVLGLNSWLRYGSANPNGPWIGLVLVFAALVVILLSFQSQKERRQKRIWLEIATCMRPLAVSVNKDETAAVVADRARLLLRAKTAWLWWVGDDSALKPAAIVGQSRIWPMIDTIDNPLANRLHRGIISLAELNAAPWDQGGVAIALRKGGALMAVLAISWGVAERESGERPDQLHIVAPWLAGVLAEAKERAALADELRWERAFRRAAAELAATSDGATARQIIANVAASGLHAAVSFIESPAPPLDPPRLAALTAAGADASLRTDLPSDHPANANSLRVEENIRNLTDRDQARFRELVRLSDEALDRCAAHQAVQDEARSLHSILQSLAAPLAVWDDQGTLLLANSAYRSLRLYDIVPRGVAPAAGREIEVVAGDQLRTFVSQPSLPHPGQTVVLYREITREREALRTKDQLISVVGHELRSPLTSIYGYSQMMSRQLGVVQRQVNQLNRLIGDFTDAARLDGTPLPIHRQPVDVAELVGAAAERFRGAFEGRLLAVEAMPVPPVAGDLVRLGQVLDNLLANAAKYSSEEEEIVLAVSRVGEHLVISVRDRGVGIAPEHLPYVFDRLYRAPNSATAEVKGLGLGLSIVRDLVKAHDGQVWAESDGPGKGSQFHICLPSYSGSGQPPELVLMRPNPGLVGSLPEHAIM